MRPATYRPGVIWRLLRQVAETRELRELVESTNRLLASRALTEQVPAAVSGTENFVQYLVLLVVATVVASFFAVMIGLVGYRYLAARLERRV